MDRKWPNPLTFIAFGLLILHMGLKYGPTIRGGEWPKDSGFDAIALALLLIALVPWIADFLSDAKLPGGFELAFRAVQRRQELSEQAIAQLRFIVDGFLTRDEYQHLLNIRDKVEYEVKSDAESATAAELRRLRALGLIEGFGIRAFCVPDGNKRRISDVLRLTDRGNEYLIMRKINETLGSESIRSQKSAQRPEQNS